MTPQSSFMITGTINRHQREELSALLASMNSAPVFAYPRNTLLPYWQLKQLHVARFIILEANTNYDIKGHGIEPGMWPPTLCFIGDIDGDADTFLAELVIRAEPGLRQIFSHCEGFDPVHISPHQFPPLFEVIGIFHLDALSQYKQTTV